MSEFCVIEGVAARLLEWCVSVVDALLRGCLSVWVVGSLVDACGDRLNDWLVGCVADCYDGCVLRHGGRD